MSEALYNIGGLRFYNERDILIRNQAIDRLFFTVSTALKSINSAWRFERVEGPLLTPREFISPSYDESDIFLVDANLGDSRAALRAETTASSYLYADHLMKSGKARLPLCVWQVGKSFRRETNDGARASELRYNEFYQMEFQCIYSVDTKADYRTAIKQPLLNEIKNLTRSPDARFVDSDRLPEYSEITEDIEVIYNGKWKEMCSISTRKDFPNEKVRVLEAAIGLDRVIAIEEIS